MTYPAAERRIWRSMLFVPAHVDKFVAAAHTRGADAYLLDLEDSVPLPQKAEARARLADAARQVSQSGAAALARINSGADLIEADLLAAVIPGIQALMLPKVESAAAVQAIDARVTALEAERGIASGSIQLIAQIEDVRTLPLLDAIASSSPRLLGMILGSEDFSVSAGMEPCTETLFAPNQQMLFACRRAGILPFGFPGSISVFRDLDAFRALIVLARKMGFVGSYAIHPNQVTVMNEEFMPPAIEVEQARGLLAAFEQAKANGRGAFEYLGRMVDPPVVARAQELIRRASPYLKE